MLSEKQFRERVKTELRQIGDQVLGLATDCDVYWKIEKELIEPTRPLYNSRSAVLDLLRGNYADAMTARILGLLDGDAPGLSLPRVLAQLAAYPELLRDRITEHEFAGDREALVLAAASLKRVLIPRVEHHERTLSALAATHRELDAVVDLMTSTVKTYYWIVGDGYLDLEPKYAEDPLSVFHFAHATPVLAK